MLQLIGERATMAKNKIEHHEIKMFELFVLQNLVPEARCSDFTEARLCNCTEKRSIVSVED